jgi:hypothetical protein
MDLTTYAHWREAGSGLFVGFTEAGEWPRVISGRRLPLPADLASTVPRCVGLRQERRGRLEIGSPAKRGDGIIEPAQRKLEIREFEVRVFGGAPGCHDSLQIPFAPGILN